MRTSSPVSSADLAEGRLLASSRRGRACPSAASRCWPSRSRRRLPTTSWGTPGRVSDDDAARGGGGGGPQACHGAAAALGRRPAPERPERAQCIVTNGRTRRSRTMRPGRSRTAPARAQTRVTGRHQGHAAGSGRRATAENDARAPRPSRRSRRAARRTHEIAPPVAPRTWRRCCVPWAAMVLGQSCLASAFLSESRMLDGRLRCEHAHARGRDRSRGAPRPHTAAGRPGHGPRARRGGPSSVPTSPRVIGPVSAARMPEGAGIAERALDKRSVDREGPGLVETGDRARARRSRRAGRRTRRRRAPRRRGTRPSTRARAEPHVRPMPLGHVGQHRREVVVALDRDGRAVERGDRPFRVGERDERVERADLRPGRHRRSEDLGAERPARMDHGLAAVHPDLAGERPDRVVGDGEDDQLDLLDQRLRLGEGARTLDGARRTAAGGPRRGSPRRGSASRHGSGRVPALCRPRRPRRSRSRVSRPARTCDADGVAVGVDLAVAMAVVPGRDRVEVDPGSLDRGLGLGSITLRIVTGKRPQGFTGCARSGLRLGRRGQRPERGTLASIESSEPAE